MWRSPSVAGSSVPMTCITWYSTVHMVLTGDAAEDREGSSVEATGYGHDEYCTESGKTQMPTTE